MAAKTVGSTAADSKTGTVAPGVPQSSGVDLARQALAAAKEQARARGAAAQQKKTVRRGGGLRSGSGADGRDPLKLGAALDRLKTERGWEMPIAVSGVMGRWKEIVGPDVAQHSEPLKYDEDERILVVRCDSTAWATQLKWMVPDLLRRLNGELGRDTVRVIKLQGPNAPQRRYGPLRAPGSTGPGDTYG
ncbi:DUF721 domain-containing protein [Streptomyces candidus]|uniref:DUF721 domain-containing protein n=1 Tax=Streptomyces candidus TaxID=67283 RepID=UPI001608BE05|nr:UPF0232 protein [Streptomyces candidus]